MTLSFNTNITDILKGISFIAVAVLAIIFVPRFIDKFEALGKLNVPEVNIQLDKTMVESIANDLIKVHLVENNREMKELIKEMKAENNKALLSALKGRDAEIKEIADLVASLKSSIDTMPDRTVDYGEKDDPRRLESFVVYRKDADGNRYPTGILYFSPNAPEGEQFTFQQYPLDVHATVVTSEEGEEEKRHATMWVESNFIKEYRGKQFPLDLDPKNVRWAKAELKEKGWSWNPRLSIGSSFTNTAFYPSFGMSLFSYGRTSRDMDWKFLNIGMGGDSNNFFVDITPVEWNMGNRIPLVENLFVGPSVSYGVSTDDIDKEDISGGLKFTVPF